MRKNVICLLLSASLICTMLPVEGIAREAAAAGRVAKVEKSVKKAAEDADKITAGGSFGGQEDPETGQVSEDTHKWTFAEGSGVLTISGTGDMPAYTDKTYFDAPWYRYRTKIKKIVFTGDVTAVGDYAFYKDYFELATVDISAAEKLTSVGAYAFAGMSSAAGSLKEVIGISQLKELGGYAFGYTKLAGEISLPEVTEITGGYVFCETEITSVSMEKLTAISGGSVFYNCSKLESVEMPALTTISGANTFYKCSALKAIDFPKLKELTAGSTFSQCGSVTGVSLPELTTIATSAQSTFSGNVSLEKVTLPKLQSTGRYLFDGCTSLLRVDMPEVTEIGMGIFRSDISLLSANLPKASSIPAFEGCLSLVYYDFATGTLQKSISSGTFMLCDSLQRIYTHEVPKSAVSLSAMSIGYTPSESGSINTTEYLDSTVYVPSGAASKWSAYSSKAGSEKVVEVNDFSALPKEGFLSIRAKNYDMGSPVDPEVLENTSGGTVTFKYYRMYNDASNNRAKRMKLLDEKPAAPGTYYVQASAEAVDGQYFSTTSNFSEFTIYGEMGDESGKWSYNNKTNTLTIKDASVVAENYASTTGIPWYDYESVITKVVLADGVAPLTEIGDYAFYHLKNVVDFPVSAEPISVGGDAFGYCEAWERTEPLRIRELGTSAFSNCINLASKITLESGITAVPSRAFSGCSNVADISIPDTVTEFGSSCFLGCRKLTEIKIPEGVTALPDYFYSGTGVSEATIPDQITSIGTSAFNEMNITSLTLPPHLESLGASVFSGCTRLETVELPASLTTLKAGTFKSATGLKRIIIPKTVTKIEGSTSSNNGLFYGATNLELVIFERTDYTTETLGTAGTLRNYSNTTSNDQSVKDHTIDQMFQNTNATLQVICDGDTYEVLDGYAKSAYINGDPEQGKYYYNWSQTSDGWTSSDVLKNVSIIGTMLETEIQEVEALQEADYNEELWTALQAEVNKAKALPEITLDYEKVTAYLNAKDNIRKGVRAFLADTIDKCSGILQSDYFDWDTSDDDAVDAWYDYEDAYDLAKDVLEDTSLLSVAEYAKYEKDLRKAVAGLIPVPTEEARAELNKLVASVGEMKESDYTEESWAALQAALAEVQALPEKATPSAVQAAHEKLQEAVAALVKVAGGDETPAPGQPGDTTATPTPEPGDPGNTTATPTPGPGDPGNTTATPTPGPGDPGNTTATPTPGPGDPGNTVKPTPVPGGGSNNTKVTVKKVTIKKAVSKKKKTVVVQWKKLSGVTGYQVQLATNKKFKKNKKTKTVKKAKTVKATIKKLKSKKKYYVRVRAYKTVGKKKYYGKWSKVKTVKVK